MNFGERDLAMVAVDPSTGKTWVAKVTVPLLPVKTSRRSRRRHRGVLRNRQRRAQWVEAE